MANLKKISFIILVFAIVACSADPPRYRKRLTAKKLQLIRQRPAVQQKRVLARQEAVTPYPTADELKPEVPFEEGNIPDEVYGPPDETYGPPEIDQTPADQLPSEEAPAEFAPNPDAEEFQSGEEKFISPTEEERTSRLTTSRKANKKNISSRLVQKKRQRSSQRLVSLPAQLISSPVTLPLSSYTSPSQQYYISNQPFAYAANYRAW